MVVILLVRSRDSFLQVASGRSSFPGAWHRNPSFYTMMVMVVVTGRGCEEVSGGNREISHAMAGREREEEEVVSVRE